MKLLPLFLSLVVLPAGADILSVNCPVGCPSNPAGNDLVFGHVYALSNNPQTKFADWVAYEVDVRNFGPSPGRDWASDPLLDETETLEEGDYHGAHSALDVDRGHQAPLASFAGSRYWPELNYLSNITPQRSDLNQGPWKALEDAVRSAVSYSQSLYVITGPVYGAPADTLPGADEPHQVPSGYFKIVYDRSGSAIGFVMNQQIGRGADYCESSVALSVISSAVGFQLPFGLTDESGLHQRLGCN